MNQKSIVVNITRALALLALTSGSAAVCAADDAIPSDLTAVPFEQLLSMEVYSASRYVQKASEAPASVTVISAADIRDHGWRTLGDIARSVRGMYVSYDRNYSYLGERGFLRPGDYNTRFLLQVDGNRINDSVYDQAPVGNEFPLDLDLIERIEFVPGPGSSIYGSNAFFGVINVITKKGGATNASHAALEAGSAGMRKGSLARGWSDAAGGQYLLSASRYRSAGNDLYYPEFDTPDQNNGVAHNLDYERGTRLFASASRGPLSVSLMHGERTKGVPTASFGQAFNDPHSRTIDRQSYLSATLHQALGVAEQLTARVFLGSYDSFGDYVINDGGANSAGGTMNRTINRDGSAARWGGAEVSVVSTRYAGHTLLAGADLQRDYRLHQYSYDMAPYASYLDTRQRGLRAGVYVQDEVAVGDALLVNTGLRFDHNAHMAGVFSPRVALIYTLSPDSTIKAIQGSAFRAPNSYEMYYAFEGQGGQQANPDLRRERVGSTELAWIQNVGPAARVIATAFRVAVKGLITQTLDADTGMSQFSNAMAVQARGVELEYERSWQAGAHLRTSYSYVSVGAAGQQINAPMHLAKFNLAAPLGPRGLRGAIESQFVGKRRSLIGTADAFWLVNANLVAASLLPGAEVSLGVYNLLDRRYSDPASTEHVQASLAQDGRNVRLRVAYGF